MPGMPGEEKGPRLFQASRRVPLPAAFAALNIDESWLLPFKEAGTHYKEIRLKWRHIVLRCHPDRQPPGLSEEQIAQNTAEYMRAMAAFESIDTYYAANFAEKPQAAAAGAPGTAAVDGTTAAKSTDTSPREPTGSAAAAAAPNAPATSEPAVDVSDNNAQEPTKPKGPAYGPTIGKGMAGTGMPEPLGVSENAKAAKARAARPLLLKQRVEVMGLQAKPAYNGRTGVAIQFDRNAGRYAVELDPSGDGDKGGEKLKVREANLKLVEGELV